MKEKINNKKLSINVTKMAHIMSIGVVSNINEYKAEGWK